MTLKWLFFSRNCENCPATGGFAPRPPSMIQLNCIRLLNMPPKLQDFFKQGHVNFWFKSLSKVLVAAVRFYFIQEILDTSFAPPPPPLKKFLRAPLHIINGSRKDRRVYSVNKLNDHQEGFFFNRLITDFEPMALKLNDSWRRLIAHPKHKSAWYLKFKKLVFEKIEK